MSKKEQIIAMLNEGKSYNQIVQAVGCSKATISFHANRIGKSGTPQRDKNKTYDWVEIQKYYDEGHSIRECMGHFGFTSASWYKAMKRGEVHARHVNIPTLEQLLVAKRLDNGSGRTGRWYIKQRLMSAGILTNTCAICSITEWLGQPIVMELDHINGKKNDHRLENLRMLCPNCHSQTPTHRSKNKLYQERNDG